MPSRVETLRRLNTVLGAESSTDALNRPSRDDLEPNPWRTSVRPPAPGNGDSPTKDIETLSVFPSEDPTTEQVRDAAGHKRPSEESREEDAAADPGVLRSDIANEDQAGQRAEVIAFRAAVSEARQEAEKQLASVVEKTRKVAAEEHADEVAQIADRHAQELQQIRETIEAEVTKRVRHEESQRHAAEVARMREEFERRYADDLQGAQAAVVDSFKSLTANFPGSL